MVASAATTFSCRLGGKVQQVGNRVQVPPEDRLPGGPFPISLPQLLYGDVVFAVGVRLLVGRFTLLDLVEEVPDHLASLPGSSLDD